MTNNSLDPRYDPMFQRGYEGRLDNAAVTPRTQLSDQVTPLPSALPPPPRPTVRDDSELDAMRAFLQPRPEAATPAQPVVTTEIFGEAPNPARRLRTPNPFIIGLWLLGPALIIVSVSALFRAFTEQSSRSFSSAEEMALLQVAWSLAPVVATIGLGIIAGLLFWHARAWKRARP